MQERQNLYLSRFDVFKFWLFANLILSLLFGVLSILSTKFTHDGLFDTEMIFIVIFYGFLITLPSLFVLFIAKYLYKKYFNKISVILFFIRVIILINLVYLAVTIIEDTKIIYLLAYTITTLSGLFSLKIVTRKNKTNA
jgi:hypothetical protein